MDLLEKLKWIMLQRQIRKNRPRPYHPQPTQRDIYTQEELASTEIVPSLQKNLDQMTRILGKNVDFVKRTFFLGQEQPLEAAVIYIDNLIDPPLLDREIMSPLLEPPLNQRSGVHLLKVLTEGGLISRAEIKQYTAFDDIISSLLTGEVILLVDSFPRAFAISCKGYKMRDIPQPSLENSVRGPRDAFIEGLPVNIGLIRKRLASPNLVVETLKIGKVSNTTVALLYIKTIASEGLVAEVRKRLERIDIDVVLESGYLEHFIKDSPYSPFPQMLVTERPDRVVGNLAEGKVAVLTDNTPLALVVPGELLSLLQHPEDYYVNFYFATLIRWLRYLAFLAALTLPSLYIAITNFHQEMIPTTLFISIAAARQGVPFPAFLEALLMEAAFETLREAGIRLPGPIGQAVSIVGALVIGQAAVQANIVSPLMVIVVAFTGIATFTIPQYNFGITIRMLRFPLMISAAFLGLFGVMIGLLAILLHLCSLRSFGVPYLSPLAPFNWQGLKDTLIVAPHWTRSKRPAELVQQNNQLMGRNLKPRPPGKKE
ncbi:spore germination protein [Desulforamulus ruminis]|uniref:GerA spore germination protein n=1 Tax=Desulforamulus ruminis (strain ATCC 23193 / DSM 2154 / NCIMB 8452 / DL) TaxID=696281 RepID=F6DLW4_DESRL|nr:spore germination protein [Desulforamulus ruminis]AEG58407.1 GerA spore germination protein [Desulforamulus ruminis DSM 2154]